MARQQKQINLRLMRTALELNPNLDTDDFEFKVIRDNNCFKNSIEFEIALTIVIV